MPGRYLSFLFFLLLTVSSCKSIEPAAPVLQPQAVPSPPIAASSLSIPIEIDLKPYFTLADKQVDTRFTGGESPCEGVSYNYYFERDALKLSGKNTEVTTEVNGRYKIQMAYCAKCTGMFSSTPVCLSPIIPFSCGINEPMRKIRLSFISDFSISPDYSLKTNTRLGDLEAIDACRVTLFQFDVTNELLKQIRKSLGKLADDIDKQTKKISFRNEATQAWSFMQHPIPVSTYGYLHLNPERILLSRPTVTGTRLNTTLQLVARPVFSSRPAETGMASLPPLVVSDSKLNDTLSLYSDIALDYDSLSVQLTQQLQHKELNLKGKKIQLDDVRINGAANGFLVFKITFSGDKSGVLYLTGQPVLDAANEAVWLTSVDFDLETKNLLLKSAKWLFNDRILQTIADASRQDLKPHITSLIASVNKSLNYSFQGYQLSGKVLEVKLPNLYAAEKELVIRLQARAKLKLTDTKN